METKLDVDDIIYIPFKIVSLKAYKPLTRKNQTITKPIIKYNARGLGDFSYLGYIYLEEEAIERLRPGYEHPKNPRWTPGIIKPEKSGNYLVEYDSGITHIDYYEYDLGDWNSRIYGKITWKVAAWMPLPEPFAKQEKI